MIHVYAIMVKFNFTASGPASKSHSNYFSWIEIFEEILWKEFENLENVVKGYS